MIEISNDDLPEENVDVKIHVPAQAPKKSALKKPSSNLKRQASAGKCISWFLFSTLRLGVLCELFSYFICFLYVQKSST